MPRFHPIVLLAALCTLPACQPAITSQPVVLSPEEAATLAIPSLPPTDPASLVLPRFGSQTYLYTAGPHEGQTAPTQTRPSPYEAYDFQNHTADNRIEYLASAETGATELHMTEDLHHKAATFYDPPVPVVPHDLQPGQSRTFQTRLTILGLHTPALVRDSGTGTVTVTNDGPHTVG
ncbi:MAG: hypothetical protein ACYTGQ_14485, partial [Planctomycetota bacterium]